MVLVWVSPATMATMLALPLDLAVKEQVFPLPDTVTMLGALLLQRISPLKSSGRPSRVAWPVSPMIRGLEEKLS